MGVVANEDGDVVEGRSVVVVDASGRRTEARSDAAGRFAVGGVSVPYDVAVGGAFGAVTLALGLARPDPWIELSERGTTTASSASQRIRLHARWPAEPAWTSVEIATRSKTGRGRTSLSSEDADLRSSTIDVDHGWETPVAPSDETIDVHVFATRTLDGSPVAFGYGRLGRIPVRAGATSDVGAIDVLPVSMREPVTFGVRPGVLDHLSFRTDVDLDIEGVVFGIAVFPAPFGETPVPSLPGTKLRAAVRASHPRGSNSGGFQRTTTAWSGSRTFEEAARPLEIALGPEPVTPAIDGVLPSSDRGFVWQLPPGGIVHEPTLHTLVVADTVRGVVRIRARTNDGAVTLDRLARLGVPPLLEGAHTYELVTHPGARLDDVFGPSAAIRHVHTDRALSGATTTLRVPFTVTR